MPKKSKTQEFLEARVIYRQNGVIDLKRLWEKEDVELDPKIVEKYAHIEAA
jgi:hypothetical protein